MPNPTNLQQSETSQLRTITELSSRRESAGGAGDLALSLAGLKTASIASLLITVQATDDPLVLWAAHMRLQSLGVPPCLRHRRDDHPQLEFITWLADAWWLAKNHTGHMPLRTRWKGLFQMPTTLEQRVQWHKTALWVFRQGSGPIGHYHSKGLGLSDAMLQPLLSMRSNSMRRNRETIRRLPEYRSKLLQAALDEPKDKSGVWTSERIADRRAELLRLYLLAGRSKTKAAQYLKLLTGEKISRQAFAKQLAAIQAATGLRSLRFS